MSDIIYTPPASSGGGQNPTTNYIPLNNGTSSFVDSILYNDKANFILYAENDLNQAQGLYLDTNDRNFQFGDLTGNYIGYATLYFTLGVTQFYDVYTGSLFFEIVNFNSNVVSTNITIDADNQLIKTRNNNNDIGLLLNFATNEYFFGNIQNSNFGVYCANGQSKLGDAYGNFNGIVVNVDDTAGNINLVAGVGLTLDVNTNTIETNAYANYKGLKLDFLNDLYFLGDYNGLTNSTQIIIANGSKEITLWAENSLQFKGAGLQSASAGGSSGEHLVIYLNGTQYKIALLNP